MVPNSPNTSEKHRQLFRSLFERTNLQVDQDFEFSRIDNNTYDLSYACLLIPRFTNHLLVGDITSFLQMWLQNLCISYDWRLDYIDFQPTYFHWIMRVQMTDAPARIIKIVKSNLSKQIFEEFPRFKKENQSNDFWAGPSLVLAGRQPHPDPLIREFIRITREGQGIPFWNRDEK
ncbi:MAG: transposase [Chloroflexota bacterium]|jgi:REP element-mobilizing transposase RayT